MMSIRLPQALLFLEHTSVSRLEDPSQWLDLLVRVTNTVFDTDLKEVLRTSAVLKVLFSNVWRRETFQWFLDVLSIVLRLLPQSPEAEAAEPEILFLDDLHRINMTFWVLLDEVIVPKLRPLGDGAEDAGGFSSPEAARGLRDAAYSWASAAPGGGREAPPPPPPAEYITLVSYDGPYGDIANKEELAEALREAARSLSLGFRALVFSNATGTAEQIRAMRTTRLLVGRSGAALVNAVFLPPGSALLELFPYHGGGGGALTGLSRALSWGAGDVAYRSWRAESPSRAEYRAAADARFAHFPAEDCGRSATCAEVHDRAAIVVDARAVGDIALSTAAAASL